MQTWARRGLQTALVTGGLLMLGTGIASAHENVSPDTPASPIDGGVSVPVNVGNNALGTPFGQKNLPGVDRTVSTHEVTDAVTGALPQSAGLPTDGVTSATGKLPVALSKAAPSVSKALPT
ncbi:MAG TPA: PE-PGRS family protein, partial [Pseudonocardiaceae bacterium]